MLPISDILIRSISGYVFIIPVLMLYFLYKRKNRDENKAFFILPLYLYFVIIYLEF